MHPGQSEGSSSTLKRTPPSPSPSKAAYPPSPVLSPESGAEPPSEYEHMDFVPTGHSDEHNPLLSSNEPSSIDPSASSVIEYSQLDCDFDDAKDRIGVGTYGAVYVGRYFGELVAIKRIHVPRPAAALAQSDPYVAARHKEAIRQFAREIRRYERISHPGIVRFLGVTLPPDASALLVTELMRGGSLGAAISDLRRAHLPFEHSTIVRIAMQACGGLRALHQANCTWGDAKPENILLSEPVDAYGVLPTCAEARIADFGLSRSVEHTLLADTTLAGSRQPAGTYNYMAPESLGVIDKQKPDQAKASDIFSFGMVIYEMITLRTPFRRCQLMDVYNAVKNGERPTWPVESDKDYFGPIPKELKALVEQCWAQDPRMRPNADGVFNALEQYRKSLGEVSSLRQVIEMTSDPDSSDAMAYNDNANPAMPRVGSRSTVSTAIAIGDGSVDLSGLNSTRESQRLCDGSDDDDDTNSTIAPAPPRMSPITSPEPRNAGEGRSDEASGPDSGSGPTSQAHAVLGAAAVDAHQMHQHRKNAASSNIFSQHNHFNFVNANENNSKTLLMQSMEGSTMFDNARLEASHQSTTVAEDGSALEQQESIQDLNQISAKEFIKNRDQIAMATAKAAADIVRKQEGGANGDGDIGDLDLAISMSNGHLGGSTVGGFDGLSPELSSSNNSSASLRRKRSKRLQSIIEHAALAFIEMRRRDESLTNTPPRQRKEAAERKAQEDARLRTERDALKTIDSAKKNGDFSIVLGEMRTHRDSRAVIKLSTSFLEQYCNDESFYLDICEEGGVEELVSAAALHGTQDEALSVLFCNCIKALSEHYDHKVGHLVRAVGAPSSVIELLQFHKTAVEVQIAGCECLAVIAGSSELSRSAVATLGGPAAVYQAMTKNNTSFKDVRLARAALKAIRHIAQDNERAAEFLVQVAALDTVVRAAETFTTDGIEGDILAALRAFSFYDGGRRNVIMSSGLKALTSIMLRNQEPDFSVQCCTFIREIARWRDLECEQNMLQSCISERITALMQMSNDIPGEEGARVAWYASHACTFLASFGSKSRQRLRVVGAIEMAIEILNKRIENARVVHSATDALAELIRNEPESKATAEQYNAVAVLREALDTHRNIARVKNALQWTLDYISSNPKQPVSSGKPPSGANSRVIDELKLKGAGQPGHMTTQEPKTGKKWYLLNFGRKR